MPAFTLADFQRLPLPAGEANIEPPNGRTLINFPTNVFAKANQLTLDTTLVGLPVRVRATPTWYDWDFGDGGRLGPTTDPGAAYPALRTTYEYAHPGDYAVTLTTYYAGEYSIAGGPWIPIVGEARVASPAQPLTALAARTRLVAEPVP